MVKYPALAIVLFLFWLLLSGHYVALLLIFGALSALLSTWLIRRMDRTDHEPYYVFPSVKLLRYVSWLMVRVILDNIDVARRILHPEMPIHPVWQRLDIKVDTPMQKTVYANSITLTPGTLTTDVLDGHFMVHSLSMENIEWLRQGHMEKRIEKLGF